MSIALKGDSLPPRTALDLAVYALLIVVGVYVAIFVGPALWQRILFFGELEHQEGAFLNTLRFWQEGGNPYQLPDLRFAGVIYAPGYLFFARAFSAVFGLSFVSLRLLSVTAIIGTAYCSYVILRHFSAPRWVSASWLPLFFAMWPRYGWIDIVRLEALFMLATFAGAAVCMRAGNKTARYFLAGCLFGAAIGIKQTAFALLPLLAVAALFERKFVYSVAAALAVSCLIYGVGFGLFGPPLYEWIVMVPRQHSRGLQQAAAIARVWMVDAAGFAILMPLFAIGAVTFDRSARRQVFGSILLAGIVATGALIAALPMVKTGSVLGNLALLNAFASLAVAWCCSDAIRGSWWKKAWVSVGLLLVIVFAGRSITRGHISQRTPDPIDSERYRNLVEFVRQQPGEVWVTNHPWVNSLAGKRAYVSLVQAGGEWAMSGRPMPDDIFVALRQKRFSMVLTGNDYVTKEVADRLALELQRTYRRRDLSPDMGIRLIDGASFSPNAAWFPKD